MKLLLVGTSFLPSYGGPARSVSQLAEAIGSMGATVGIWSPDGSAEHTQFLTKNALVKRLCGSVTDTLLEFGTPDLVHDNGIWLNHNHRLAQYCRRRNITRIVSTRGMLEPWALAHKRLKKTIAWYSYQRHDLRTASALHATSEMEADSIKSLGLKRPIWVVPNGVMTPPQPFPDSSNDSRSQKAYNVRTAIFIGRLYPVKGLPLLLDTWAAIRPPGWRLRIIGPDEAGHAKILREKIKILRLSNEIELEGPLEGEEKWQALRDSDLFICPSYTENFGIAIAEAMACGLPVLTTTGTPWQTIADQKMGWWVQPNQDTLVDALQAATSCSDRSLREMGLKSRRFVSENFGWSAIAKKMMTHYEKILLAGTKQP